MEISSNMKSSFQPNFTKQLDQYYRCNKNVLLRSLILEPAIQKKTSLLSGFETIVTFANLAKHKFLGSSKNYREDWLNKILIVWANMAWNFVFVCGRVSSMRVEHDAFSQWAIYVLFAWILLIILFGHFFLSNLSLNTMNTSDYAFIFVICDNLDCVKKAGVQL